MPNTDTLESLGMLGPDAFQYPVTGRYVLEAPWGFTSQEITVDAPALASRPDKVADYFRALWTVTIAPAISHDVALVELWTAQWKTLAIPTPIPVTNTYGLRLLPPAAREHSVQLVLMPDSDNPNLRRRLFLPGVPAGYVGPDFIEGFGWPALLSQARGAFMGLQPLPPAVQTAWLVAYPGAVRPAIGNALGVGFRRVRSVRVCWHVDRAPELPAGIWPPVLP